MENLGMLWSDTIDLENDKGWFGASEINALFEVNFKNNEYKYLHKFIDYKIEGKRKYSICQKYRDKIFCFPVYGNKIWVYHIRENNFTKIELKNINKNGFMCFAKIFIHNNCIYAVSYGLNAIFEIDPEKEMIKEVINISSTIGVMSGDCIHNDNLIYCISRNNPVLIKVNLKLKEVNYYHLPFSKEGLSTISLMENKCMVFSGLKKEIYIWNIETNKTVILSDFPVNFGIYKRDDKERKLLIDYYIKSSKEVLFLESINMKNRIWFIPFRTNNIIYMDKNTYKLNSLEIENEDENIESWDRKTICKYKKEYVYKDRFIGIYSFKNKTIFEIDNESITVKKRDFFLDKKSIEELYKEYYSENSFFEENSKYQRDMFIKFCKKNKVNFNKFENRGKKIYERIV